MRTDRCRQPLADPRPHRLAACRARADLSLHLLFHAVLERIHLRADLYFLDAVQDRAGRHRNRAGRWRHLPLGVADGWRDDRFAAAGHPLRFLRGALCFGDDRRGERVAVADSSGEIGLKNAKFSLRRAFRLRTVWLVIAVATGSIGLLSSARAQADYPNRPVQLIIAYGAGTIGDVSMRILAEKLSNKLGKNFVVENRPGAAGVIAAKAAAMAAPD